MDLELFAPRSVWQEAQRVRNPIAPRSSLLAPLFLKFRKLLRFAGIMALRSVYIVEFISVFLTFETSKKLL